MVGNDVASMNKSHSHSIHTIQLSWHVQEDVEVALVEAGAGAGPGGVFRRNVQTWGGACRVHRQAICLPAAEAAAGDCFNLSGCSSHEMSLHS
jgi:hypothetical protein